MKIIDGIKLPSEWSKMRGFVAPEDRKPRQGEKIVSRGKGGQASNAFL